MSDSETITAAIIVIGDEILSGRTTDKNINHIACQLVKNGISLCEVRVIPDVTKTIITAVNEMRTTYHYVFTTGGIGPTHDDITADAIAAAFDVPIELDDRAIKMMSKRYGNEQMQGERLRMARIPHGAQLIENPVSHAPGFMLENVAVMAGIPRIMQAMLENLMPRLRKGKPVKSTTISVIVPESHISVILREMQQRYQLVSIGSYPFIEDGKLAAQLVLRSTSKAELNKASLELMQVLEDKNLDPVIVEGDQPRKPSDIL